MKPWILTVVGLALAGLLWGSAAPVPALAAPTEAPRLVLLVAVDQMRYDYLPRFAAAFTGGLPAARPATGPSSRTRTSTTTRRSPRSATPRC